MKARAGVTLIEVLIAIFIMAIGLLALMTLFPLGAFSMARAIQDQRVNEAAEQANAIANSQNVRIDPYVTPYFGTSPNAAHASLAAVSPPWDGPSYPVFVDPWGKILIGTQLTTASNFANSVYRTNLSFVTPPTITTATSVTTSSQNALRWNALQDELSFLPTGVPGSVRTNQFDREPRTTWAYWLRQPNYSVTNVVEVTIVVYSGRDLILPPAEPEKLLTPTASGVSSVTVASNTTTSIRPGQWIVDVSYNSPTSKNTTVLGQAKTYGPIPGSWYRVTKVEDTSAGIVLQLYPSLPVWPITGATVPITGFVVMEGVSDVFAKGAGWK